MENSHLHRLKPAAGIIKRIRLENFMCHDNLQMDFGDWVNFITGQNGSGKSAILTALCVAFGTRARATQRASTLKDFIKTGCSHALVVVEIKNQGDDSFKNDVYGDLIILERRITHSSSSMILKNHLGKKVGEKREELYEIIEHFNIDVDNPCVVMSQDRSREFLHSGSDKDKFRFYYKATLLQQVSELLESVTDQLSDAYAKVDELESSIKPTLKELDELQEKIKSMEHVEAISRRVNELTNKLAWCWVYDAAKQIEQSVSLQEKLKARIPACESKIRMNEVKIEEITSRLLDKKEKINILMERTVEARKSLDVLQQNLSQATRVKLELEEDITRRKISLRKFEDRVRWLRNQIEDVQEQHVRNTQVEKSEMDMEIAAMQAEYESARVEFERYQEEEGAYSEEISRATNVLNRTRKEFEEHKSKIREISTQIESLRNQSVNKMTAFGGDRVNHLFRVIEKHHREFTKPPIGPIGVYLGLKKDDTWALAIEYAIGRLLNAFVVTNHRDFLLMRRCAKEASYFNVQIIVYDFDRPPLDIPLHMLPQTNHPTVISVLDIASQTDSTTIKSVVKNVLVDHGHAERQVLVRDYEVGKSVAFDQRIPNLKEVFTSEGHKMFQRGSVQTTLPPNRRTRGGRLCSSVDGYVLELEKESIKVREQIHYLEKRKRDEEHMLKGSEKELQVAKKRRLNAYDHLTSMKIRLQNLQHSSVADLGADAAPDVDELVEEMHNVQGQRDDMQMLVDKLQAKLDMEQQNVVDCKLSLENFRESAKEEINALAEAEKELLLIEEGFHSAEKEKLHYENLMQKKVLLDIENEETRYEQLKLKHEEMLKKANIICPESELESIGGCDGTPEQFSAQLDSLKKRLRRESERHSQPIEDLRMVYEAKERKVLRKKQAYAALRDKLNVCKQALAVRWGKFERNATLLKRQLTWQFNGHLRRKGFSGHIKVDYEEKTLRIEVNMNHDTSNTTVRDTRGLSGGERSFSTLCFALALHEMTEAPFRAMDEFDVFMDAVSRKISLDTLLDFAVAEGSQWIFITPHDISTVKAGDRVKKQQMAAPRA